MSGGHVPAWVAAYPLTPVEVDCATAVMLKILDGKCKMSALDKVVMAALYDAICDRPGVRLGAPFHALIAQARAGADEAMRLRVYEQRVLAETAISRPVMKQFKARLRQDGLFDGLAVADEDDAGT